MSLCFLDGCGAQAQIGDCCACARASVGYDLTSSVWQFKCPASLRIEGICGRCRSLAVVGRPLLSLASPSLRKTLHRCQGLAPSLCSGSCRPVCGLCSILRSAQIKFEFTSGASIIFALSFAIISGFGSLTGLSFHR